jgi:hypothetical protein
MSANTLFLADIYFTLLSTLPSAIHEKVKFSKSIRVIFCNNKAYVDNKTYLLFVTSITARARRHPTEPSCEVRRHRGPDQEVQRHPGQRGRVCKGQRQNTNFRNERR